MSKLLRYPELKARGIVSNRETLRRWIAGQGFPAPVQLGPNSVAWSEAEIEAWLTSRSRASKTEAA